MKPYVSSTIFVYLFLLCASLVVTVHVGHSGEPDNDNNDDDTDDSSEGTPPCEESCFKFSELEPNSSGERFLQGKCTVKTFYPVPEEICTCFFNLGYHCYINNPDFATSTTNPTTTDPISNTTESFGTRPTTTEPIYSTILPPRPPRPG